MFLFQTHPRRRFNRSLTEVRPDAYIFDDGLHFEVRPVLEEDELIKSRETLNEPLQKQRARKLSSVLSEDSELYPIAKQYTTTTATPEIVETVTSPKTKSPFLNIVRQAASSESKDTLTPVEANDDHTLVENDDDDGSVENIMELNFESARQRALRRRSMGRRCSEQHSSNHDLNRSQTSLNAGMCRRQLSLTHSEPDSGNDGPTIKPAVKVKTSRQLLLQFHTEYTSITDELESVCHMMTSPTMSSNRDATDKSRSTAEFAAMLEKQHLKECEESDYIILSKLFSNRDSINETEEPPADVSPSVRKSHSISIRNEIINFLFFSG